MRVFYDSLKDNIIFEGFDRYFSLGSLIAIGEGNNIDVKYTDTNISEFYILYSDILKEDGTTAGETVQEVVDYLNEEFNKGSMSEQMIYAPIGGRFLLDPNEINGWGSIGMFDDVNTQDLGNVGAGNLNTSLGGLVFPFDVKLKGFQAWHNNTNSLALAWGWVIAVQTKNENSTTVTTDFILDESTVRAGVLNGLGLRDYLNNRAQYTEIDFSNDDIIIQKGQVLNLAVSSPTAIIEKYYVDIQAGNFTFIKV